jgi:hypothetical protein
MSNLLLFLSVLFCANFSFGQLGDWKLPSYFGIQTRAIFPSAFVGNPLTTVSKDAMKATLTQNLGYSFGGVVRVGITELIALETGINFTQRYFRIEGSLVDSNIYVKNDLGFIQYDIPINALFYVKMTKQWYANASLGVAAGFKPTSIATLNNINGTQIFYHTGVVENKASLDLNGNLGFEFRSKRSGFFYLGTSVRLPIRPLFVYVATFKDQSYKATQYGNVSGAYLSLDLRYFFRNIKATNQEERPIE